MKPDQSRRHWSRAASKRVRSKVRQLMREQNLKAIQPGSFKPRTTDSGGVQASPNLLAGVKFAAAGKIIVGDITYIALPGGRFCYSAMWQDKVTRRIIGWSLAQEMTAELVISALKKASGKALIKAGAIIHSDPASQYAANGFRELLSASRLWQSMSGKGKCYDNARAESFFSRFKTELLEGGQSDDAEQARSEIFSYIEGYYNRVRLHSGLGYKSPLEFEMELKTKNGGRRDSFVSTFS